MMLDLLPGPLVTLALIGITTIIFFYWYYTRTYDYWKVRNVPYVEPFPVLGSLEMFRKPIHEVESERYRKYGKLYGHFEGSRPLLSVADPELLRDIFVKDFFTFPSRRLISSGDVIVDNFVSILEGEDWKRVRNIITPTFSTGKIKRMISIFKDCSKTLLQNFTKEVEKGKPVDIKNFYGAFTMDVIASSAFSTKLDSHNDPNNKFVLMAKGVFGSEFGLRFAAHLIFPKLVRLLKISIVSGKVSSFFKDVTLQIIEERRRTGQKRNDFLQLLIDSAAENVDKEEFVEDSMTSNYGEDETNPTIFKNVSSKKLSIDEMVAQCVIFFLAGYDTIGNTLSFTTYLLALNPDVQEKLFEEIKEAVSETNGEVTYDVLQKLKYLDNVISECLRIYPPVGRHERTAAEDTILKDTGIQVPKGMIITIPAIAIHMDPKYFPNPEKFDPHRFDQEEREKRPGYTYMPFGLGPRGCLGMRFALVEIKVCLLYLLSKFEIKRCPETRVPLEFNNGVGLLEAKHMVVEFKIREDSLFLK